jgi:hypothetical protein
MEASEGADGSVQSESEVDSSVDNGFESSGGSEEHVFDGLSSHDEDEASGSIRDVSVAGSDVDDADADVVPLHCRHSTPPSSRDGGVEWLLLRSLRGGAPSGASADSADRSSSTTAAVAAAERWQQRVPHWQRQRQQQQR